jgi:hypothetical protein
MGCAIDFHGQSRDVPEFSWIISGKHALFWNGKSRRHLYVFRHCKPLLSINKLHEAADTTRTLARCRKAILQAGGSYSDPTPKPEIDG